MAGISLVLACATGAAAQGRNDAAAHTRALLARAESLLVDDSLLDLGRSRAERERRRPRLLQSRGLTLMVPQFVSAADAQQALDSAYALLQEFGGIPESFVGKTAVFGGLLRDTIEARLRLDLRGMRLAGAPLLRLEDERGKRWSITGPAVASAISHAYGSSLDDEWQRWLPGGGRILVGDWTRPEAWTAFDVLTRSRYTAANRCVGGDPGWCRKWLGLDRDADPYEARYGAADLRRLYQGDLWWHATGSDTGQSCLEGVDASCIALAHAEKVPSEIPAGDEDRRGFLRAVHALYGPAVVATALADTAGSVAVRLAQAAGVPGDSLVMRWRYWILTRGGRPRERSPLADAVPALLLASILLALVARSRGS